ncbi:MAG: site-specific integrase [Eggerthellaceae bacterium]|nr:site-specific integrase [Eggerthellaceae bacterium]
MGGLNPLFRLIHDYLVVHLPEERKMSPNTVRSYRKALELLVDFVKELRGVPLADVSFEMIDRHVLLAFLDHLEQDRGCSPATRNHRLHCVRAFYAYAAREDVTAVRHYDEISKVRPARIEERPVEHMSESAVQSILDQPDTSTAIGRRDAMLMLFLYKTGARVQELVDVRICDLRLGKSAAVTLHGKGGKVRTVPLRADVAENLVGYIGQFHPGEGPHSEQRLFYTVRGGEKKRMTEQNVRVLTAKYGAMARKSNPGVPERVHPHLFRHSWAMALVRSGMEFTLISQWLGHAQPETTLIYARADTEVKRLALEKAIPADSPLRPHVDTRRYVIDDEETLKRLAGLL